MRQVVDIDVEIRSHEQTLKDLHQRVVAGDEIVSRVVRILHVVPLMYFDSSEQRTRAISNTNRREAGRVQSKD